MSFTRRVHLTTAPNPDSGHDYLVRLGGAVGKATLTVRYVPDRVVLAPQTFADYLRSLSHAPLTGLEALALAVVEDFNNELVPRWLQVTALGLTPIEHEVIIEDRQPGWHNPQFIARIGVL